MISSLKNIVIGALLVASLSGCQAYTLVRAQEPIEVASTLNVTPTIDWSKRSDGNMEYWTVDGQQLQELAFHMNIGDGQPLFSSKTSHTSEDGEQPAFRSDMDTLELSQWLEESFNRSGATNFTFTNMRKQSFADEDGFHLSFSYSTPDGLEKLGLAVGSVREGKLNIAVYTGTKEYYFDKYKDDVEKTLLTARPPSV